jgi:hypothetical protein
LLWEIVKSSPISHPLYVSSLSLSQDNMSCQPIYRFCLKWIYTEYLVKFGPILYDSEYFIIVKISVYLSNTKLSMPKKKSWLSKMLCKLGLVHRVVHMIENQQKTALNFFCVCRVHIDWIWRFKMTLVIFLHVWRLTSG